MKLHIKVLIDILYQIKGSYFLITRITCEKEYKNGCNLNDEALILLNNIALPCCGIHGVNGSTKIDIDKKTAFFHGKSEFWGINDNNHSWNKLKKNFMENDWKIEYNINPNLNSEFRNSDEFKNALNLWLS